MLNRKTAKLLVSTAFLLALFIPWMLMATGCNPQPQVKPRDEAPVIVPDKPNGKKVLFDNTHEQTAGSADWVIDGGFSDFAQALANRGYEVKELRKKEPITYDDLRPYDVFVIGESNNPYKQSEQNAMWRYVQNGGSILFISDHYNADRNKNRWDPSEAFNGYRRGAWNSPTKGMNPEEAASPPMQNVVSSDWLARHFGVRFRYNAIGDVTANQIVPPDQAFGITKGVQTFAMHAGSTVAILDPQKAKGIVYLPRTNAKWSHAVDQGVYNGGGIPEGPMVAIAKAGKGKAAFIGDSSPVEDDTPKYRNEETGAPKKTHDGFHEQDDAVLLVNLVNWLAKKESYTRLSEVPGLKLDQPTRLYEWEQPAKSTEPEKEPWAPPADGYKWWDPSTFKPGSYGASDSGKPSPPSGDVRYITEHPNPIPAGQTVTIRVSADGLQPGTTVEGYRLGLYLEGGKQVAKFRNADGSWPNAYGYSAPFQLKSDSKGHAEITLTAQIDPGAKGTAYIRVKQDGDTRLTEKLEIR